MMDCVPPLDMNGLSVEGGQCSTRYSMLKLRVNHHLHFDLSVGATNVFMGAVAMTNNYICMGEVTAKWRRMLGNERFARALYVILMYEKARDRTKIVYRRKKGDRT